MKKNVLALSITAAVVSLGLAGAAHAMVPVGGNSVNAGATATGLALNGDGVGHMLLVPYFSAQAENHTLFNLVNTDMVNGKAVKVRFRGAANSDDILDFQVFLSPGDVWAADISKGADGKAVLTTNDTSCLRPSRAAVGTTTTFPFSTARLDPSLTGDALAGGTREGYIEIFNMADIPPVAAWPSTAVVAAGVVPATASAKLVATTVKVAGVAVASSTANPLFTAIKHVAKVAPCGAAVTDLDGFNPTYTGDGSVGIAYSNPTLGTMEKGMLPPTSGLMANWTIINVVGAAAWSGNAVAIHATGGVDGVAAAPTGNVIYFPQMSTAAPGPVNLYTADPLLTTSAFRLNNDTTQTKLTKVSLVANQQDLPDMSTPYTTVPAGSAAFALAGTDSQGATRQALALTKAIVARTSTNEFLTDKSISASTDWVFSMPTRRYSTALNYSTIGTVIPGAGGLLDTGVRYTDLFDAVPVTPGTGGAYGTATGGNTYATVPRGFFTKDNASSVQTTALGGRQICVTGIISSGTDREETISSSGATLSPQAAAPIQYFCGETSVLSINLGTTAAPSGSLKASVTLRDMDWGTAGYVDGWMKLTTAGNTAYTTNTVDTVAAATLIPALPTLVADYGAAFGLPVLGGAFMKASADTSGTKSFGLFFNHRFTR